MGRGTVGLMEQTLRAWTLDRGLLEVLVALSNALAFGEVTNISDKDLEKLHKHIDACLQLVEDIDNG